MRTRAALSVLSLAGTLLAMPGGALATHPTTVDVTNNRFEPEVVVVEVGSPEAEVHWDKPGSGNHNVVADDDSFTSGAPTTAPWDYMRTFTTPGEYPYYCSIHGGPGGSGMSGTVIVTDGSTSALSIGDEARTEGHSGTKSFRFSVSMDAYQADPVTVEYATSNGSATAGDDYIAKAGTATIQPGSLSTLVTISIQGDEDVEPDETFTVTLSAPSANATLADAEGTGTILNDDPPDTGEPPPPAPVADAGGPYVVEEGASVTLDGSASNDPEAGGAITAYAWDTDGDGQADAEGETVSVSYPTDGEVTVTLTVTDDDDQDASADATVTVTDAASIARSWGPGRVETAVESALDHWTTSEHAILATAFDFPDALSATALAAKLGAPLLLTPADSLPTSVLAALEELGVETVWILGGTAVVSTEVESELRAHDFDVVRRSGDDRFETARAVALTVGASPTGEAVVALGQHEDLTRDSWPDALSAGSLAASADRLPTLLTRSERLPEVTRATLAELDVRKVWLLGGTAAIREVVELQLIAAGFEVERLAGDTRYGTSVAVAQNALSRRGAGDVPLVYATGAAFPDGLTAGAVAAQVGGVVALTHPDDVAGGSPEVDAFVRASASRFDEGTVIGGPSALTDAAVAQLLRAMRA